MSATEANPAQDERTLRSRAREALFWAIAIDHAGIADEIVGLVEETVCEVFKLKSADFDLLFTDLKREIEQHLAAELDDAIDYRSARDGIIEEFSEEETDQ